MIRRRWRTSLAVARQKYDKHYPLVLLADTGCRIGEALGLYWSDLDLEGGFVHIRRSRSRRRYGPTKTGRSRTVELSARLSAVLDERQPDVFGEEAPVFATRSGGPLDDHNVRRRVFSPLVGDAFDPPRALTPHCGLGAELVIFMPVLYWLRRRPSS